LLPNRDERTCRKPAIVPDLLFKPREHATPIHGAREETLRIDWSDEGASSE